MDFHNSTDAESDLSAGWAPVVAGFRLDLGVIRYGYINEPAHTEIDTTELKAVALRDVGPATVAVTLYYITRETSLEAATRASTSKGEVPTGSPLN